MSRRACLAAVYFAFHILTRPVGRPPLFKNSGGIRQDCAQTDDRPLIPSASDTISAFLVNIKTSIHLCFDVCERL